ncbi:hypothetical protein [Xenorhabdus mauleonii]|uniref:hypothetical protein n=1 Tax=Xenorhabdus mauleonii TaxID=351675 RepID=UPI0014750302|nr:hypothetical protein [Xenorhabdus mauleonii]
MSLENLLYLVNTTIPAELLAGIHLRVIIPVVFQDAALLATLTHPSHIAIYVPGDY